ncbi:MAG: recombinase RecT [Chloroflexi bacterium]|nr:recombinase RecT [Chloroflexota bacterium]
MKALYKPIALLSIVSLILASTLTAAPVSADSHDSSHIPQGQLTRRGVTGTVVGLGGSSFVLETKFGNVTIDVAGSTVIKSGGGIVDFGALSIGDRAGVLLDRPPDAPRKASGGDDGPNLTPPEINDDTGTNPDLTHTVLADSSAPVHHAYAIVWLPGGATQFEVMDRREIDKIRSVAPAIRAKRPSPWNEWYEAIIKRPLAHIGCSVSNCHLQAFVV